MRTPWEFETPLCREIDPEAFFPEDESNWPEIRQLKNICNKCDHKVECAEWAIAKDEIYGIWGGTTANERARLKGRKRVWGG